MSDDGLPIQLLKDVFKQQQDMAVGIAKISSTQDSIKDKIDAGDSRLAQHEEIHKELGRRIGDLESDWDQRTGAKQIGDRISAGAWALLGAAAAIFANLIPGWLTHK